MLIGFGRACVGLCFKPAVGLLDLAAKVFERVKNTISAFQEKQRVRPPLVFHINRVLRPYAEHEARAQSMLINCEFDATHANLEQEFYVAHFSNSWTTRQGYAGPPKLLLVTSQRVVLGDEARLRPEWEVRVERIARVELKADHVMLWTWEKIGPGTPTASYNMIFERLIHCNNAATLEAMFLRLWHVAEQRDRATIYAHRRTQA